MPPCRPAPANTMLASLKYNNKGSLGGLEAGEKKNAPNKRAQEAISSTSPYCGLKNQLYFTYIWLLDLKTMTNNMNIFISLT